MFRITPLLTTLLLLLLSTTTLQAASPPADKIFPDATKGFVAIQNLKNFSEQWRKTQFGQLMNDPLMQDFKQEMQKQITERIEKTFGLTLDGISSLPSGEVAFGMLAIPNLTPGYVLTMDIAGKRPETDKYLENLTQKLLTVGVKKTTELYKGQQITILTFPPPEQPKALGIAKIEITIDPVERTAYYMFFQDVLIASDQPHLLKLIADRIADQRGKSLADVEAYQIVMKRCISDIPSGIPPAAIRWYIEPLDYGQSVRTLLRGSISPNRKDKPSVFSILKDQGFDAIRGIGGIVSIKTEEQESVYRTFIYTTKPYRLAMRMLTFPDNTNFTPPTWMPDDLARCTLFYADPATIFDNFGVLFDALFDDEGMWKGILDGLEKDPFGPKINLREDLITHLGNRVLSMSRYEKPITIKSESIIIAIELKQDKEPAMMAGLEKLFGTDKEMQATQHNSYKIWHRKPLEDVIAPDWNLGPDLFESPSPPAEGKIIQMAQKQAATPANPPPAFPDWGAVVAKGCLFVSTDIEYLKIILDRLDSPAESAKTTIRDATEYKEVDRIFGNLGLTDKPHFFQFFARTQETLRPTYEMIRQNQMGQSQAILAKLLNGILSPEGERRQILDGSSLPEFNKVQHYFGRVGVYGASETNGYFIKGFAVGR